MNRFAKCKYNGHLLSDVCHVENVRLPILPTRTISTLNVSSRDGEIYNGPKYEGYTIEIDILIDCDTRAEAKERLKALSEIFDVDEPKPFFIDDERFILAISDNPIEKEAIAFNSYTSTISLKCCEPYFYSNRIKVVNSVDKVINANNSGNRPTAPIFQVGFTQPTYFAQLELEQTGQKILVGKYPILNQPQIAQSIITLDDNCESTGTWTQSSASIDSDRTVGGTLSMTNDGAAIGIGTLPSGETTWKGACYRQNLERGVDEFKLTCRMIHSSNGINGDPSVVKYETDKQTVTTGSVSYYYKVTASSLNVRSGPSTSYKILGVLSNGHKIQNGTLTNGWLKFTYNGKTGYCSGKYLTKVAVDNRVTETQCNFVTKVATAIRTSAKTTSQSKLTIPAGECIRCIISTKYGEAGEENSFYKLAKAYNGKTGYVWIGNLVEAGTVTFEYDAEEDIDTADDKMGMVELYGFDANGSQLFCFGMYDDQPYYEYTYPKARIGNKVVLKDSTTVPEPKKNTTVSSNDDGTTTISLTNKLSGSLGGWNNFYGIWTITRKKVNDKYTWEVMVQKLAAGEVTKTQKSINLTSADFPTDKLSYVVVYMGTNNTLEDASSVALEHVKVEEINPTTVIENKNVTYFKEGDVLEIDCENHRCYLNDEPCDHLVDIGSRYFDLPVGDSDISIYSNDDEIVGGVIFREKWIGED